MNNARRKAITHVWDEVIGEALSKLDDAREELEAIADEEQDAYDNLPESIQASERGEAMQDYADRLAEQVSAIEEVAEGISRIVGELDDIANGF